MTEIAAATILVQGDRAFVSLIPQWVTPDELRAIARVFNSTALQLEVTKKIVVPPQASSPGSGDVLTGRRSSRSVSVGI